MWYAPCYKLFLSDWISVWKPLHVGDKGDGALPGITQVRLWLPRATIKDLGNFVSDSSLARQTVYVDPLPEGCVRNRLVLLRWTKRPRFVWLTCFWSELIFYLLSLTSGSGIRGAQAWESTFGLLRMNVQGCHTILAICFTCRVEDFDGFRPGAPSPFVSFYDFLR